jgi:hypothetical protein
MVTPSEIWELRTFEGAIQFWISEEERKGRVLVEGSEARIRAWPREKKLKWVHNRLQKQKGITEFWITVPVPVTAEVGPGSGLDVGIEPGRGRQIPSDLPRSTE